MGSAVVLLPLQENWAMGKKSACATALCRAGDGQRTHSKQNIGFWPPSAQESAGKGPENPLSLCFPAGQGSGSTGTPAPPTPTHHRPHGAGTSGATAPDTLTHREASRGRREPSAAAPLAWRRRWSAPRPAPALVALRVRLKGSCCPHPGAKASSETCSSGGSCGCRHSSNPTRVAVPRLSRPPRRALLFRWLHRPPRAASQPQLLLSRR